MFENLVQFGSELRCLGIAAHNPQKLSTSARSDPTLTVARSHRRKRRKPYSWPWLFPHIIEGEKKLNWGLSPPSPGQPQNANPQKPSSPLRPTCATPSSKELPSSPTGFMGTFPMAALSCFVEWPLLSTDGATSILRPFSLFLCLRRLLFLLPSLLPPLTVQIAQEERGKTSIPSPRHKIRLLFALLDAILQLFPVESSVTKASF